MLSGEYIEKSVDNINSYIKKAKSAETDNLSDMAQLLNKALGASVTLIRDLYIDRGELLETIKNLSDALDSERND